MLKPLRLEFYGPLSLVAKEDENSILYAKVAKQSGLYLWTTLTNQGDLIYYVGETGRNFGVRMKEHLKEQLSGMYMVYDPKLFKLGQKELIWRGMFGKAEEKRIPEYLERLPELLPTVLEFIRQMRFFVAPLEKEKKSARLRQRIEASIAQCLYSQSGIVGKFQDQIVYRPRTQEEKAIEVHIHCSSMLRGLPSSLLV